MRFAPLFAAAVALPVLLAGPVVAADPPRSGDPQEKQRRATDLAIQATQMLMQALELMIRSLPQYGPPRINENGDIVIPRIHEEPAPGGKPPGKDKGGHENADPGTPL
jgi:hypothetical protein